MATDSCLPVNETKGEISAATTSEGSRFDSTRGQKRSLDSNHFTPRVPEANVLRDVEKTEDHRKTPVENGSQSRGDEQQASKRRRIVQVESLSASEDSKNQTSLVPSSSNQLQIEVNGKTSSGPACSTLITSSSSKEPHIKPLAPESRESSLPMRNVNTRPPNNLSNDCANSTFPSVAVQSPYLYHTPSDASSYAHPVPPLSATIPIVHASSPEVPNSQPRRPCSSEAAPAYSQSLEPTSNHNNTEAQSSLKTPPVASAPSPSNVRISNGSSTLGPMTSKPLSAVREPSSSNPTPANLPTPISQTTVRTSSGSRESASVKPRRLPESNSAQQPVGAMAVPHFHSDSSWSADSSRPPRHMMLSNIINNSADAILEFFNRELKLVQAKHDVEISIVQNMHRESLTTAKAEHEQHLTFLKRASADKDVEIETLEKAHRRAIEEKSTIQQDAERRNKENIVTIEGLKQELQNANATLLQTRERHDKALNDLRESNTRQESSNEARFHQERNAWRKEQKKAEQTQNELSQEAALWSRRHGELLEKFAEDERLLACAEKARKALGEERKAMCQQIVNLEDEKRELQKRLDSKTREFGKHVDDENAVRAKQEAARRLLEEENRTLSQRIIKLEAEASDSEKAKARLEDWVEQMKTALQQQAEDDKKRITSITLAWQSKMEKAMKEEKFKGEEDGYQRGEKDGYQRGEKDGFERGEKDGFKRGEEDAYQRGNKDGCARGKAEALHRITAMTTTLGDTEKKHTHERDSWAQEKKRLEEDMAKQQTKQQEDIKKLKEDALKTTQKLDQYWTKEIEMRWEKLVAEAGKKREAEQTRRARGDAERTVEMEKRENELQAMTKKVELLEQQSIDRVKAEASAEALISALKKKVEMLEQQVKVRRQANEEDLLLGQNATALGPYSRSEAKHVLEQLVYGEKDSIAPESSTDKPCYLQ